MTPCCLGYYGRMKKELLESAEALDIHDNLAYWETVENGSKHCGSGHVQSPIDLHPCTPANLPPLEFNYQAGFFEIAHIGMNLNVVPMAENTLIIAGEAFSLQHFHFHVPAEHAINDHIADMELHFVHQHASGHLAVVGVMIEEGPNHPVLDLIWEKLPTKPNSVIKRRMPLNPAHLIPENTNYYHYIGSLTTPPFDEGPLWHIFRGKITLSETHIQNFHNIVGFNARKLQPRNFRDVRYSRFS